MSVHGVFDAYREKEVKVWGLEDIKDTVNEGNIGLKGSPTRVKKSFKMCIRDREKVDAASEDFAVVSKVIWWGR